MKNYTQVYVKNSFEAAETYCRANAVQQLLTSTAYAGGFPYNQRTIK